MADTKDEYLKKSTPAKDVFWFCDPEKGVDQLSSEIYKDRDLIVHYPRGYEGGKKYKTIVKFTFSGFKGKIPVGIIKSPFYGYGFTKILGPFSYFINEKYKFKEVCVEKSGAINFDTTAGVLYLSDISLAKLHKEFSQIFAKNRAEVDYLLQVLLHDLFPGVMKKPKKKYISNGLSSTLSSWGNSIDEFSDSDKASIIDLFNKLTLNTDFLGLSELATTRNVVNTKYLDSCTKKFETLMKSTKETSTVEKKWQAYLTDNSWIFSSMFSQPVILHKGEAYVGGKSIDNKNGKFTDFLIKNSLSNNVSFFEIKTHLSELVRAKAYRGSDVFSASDELSGCIAQVLNQRDTFQKEFYSLKVKSSGGLESFNSKCFVLIGKISSMSKKQASSFELYRSNSKDVEILTFDELRNKMDIFRTLASK